MIPYRLIEEMNSLRNIFELTQGNADNRFVFLHAILVFYTCLSTFDLKYSSSSVCILLQITGLFFFFTKFVKRYQTSETACSVPPVTIISRLMVLAITIAVLNCTLQKETILSWKTDGFPNIFSK